MKSEMEQLMEETAKVIQRFADEVEPRPWGPHGEALELVKQLGYLSQCVLLERRYKQGRAGREDFMNECSDILYMFFRICRSFKLTPTCPTLRDYGLPNPAWTVEQVVLTLAEHVGDIVRILKHSEICDLEAHGPKANELLSALERLIPCLNFLAAHYGFDLGEAHRLELMKAEAWLDLNLKRNRRKNLVLHLIRSVSGVIDLIWGQLLCRKLCSCGIAMKSAKRFSKHRKSGKTLTPRTSDDEKRR